MIRISRDELKNQVKQKEEEMKGHHRRLRETKRLYASCQRSLEGAQLECVQMRWQKQWSLCWRLCQPAWQRQDSGFCAQREWRARRCLWRLLRCRLPSRQNALADQLRRPGCLQPRRQSRSLAVGAGRLAKIKTTQSARPIPV